MSFTLSYKDLAKPAFLAGIRKLSAYSGFRDIKVTHNVAKIASQLDAEYVTYDEVKAKLAKRFPLTEKEHTPDKVQEIETEFENLMAISFEVKRPKVKLGEVEGINLSPNELLALTPILEGLDDL